MYLTLSIFKPIHVMFVVCPFILCGCMSFEEGWKEFKEPTKTGDVAELLKKAQDQINEADTREKVLEFIKTYESILEIDPYNYEALWSLGRWQHVIGTWSKDKEEKKKRYTDARKYCEQGMYTNAQFKDLVDKGEKLWDACRALSRREMAVMQYWYSSVGMYSLECLHPISQWINLFHIGRQTKILERMMEIDPTWEGGHPYCEMAIRKTLLPRLLGGDLKKAEEYYDKAVEAGPNWLYIRFIRAIVLDTKKKDREAFTKDLEWVIAQDPHKADSPYPANVDMQNRAREMLANIDAYF